MIAGLKSLLSESHVIGILIRGRDLTSNFDRQEVCGRLETKILVNIYNYLVVWISHTCYKW